MEGLKGSTLNILGVWALRDDIQVDVLQDIAEIRPKKAKVFAQTANVEFLQSFIESLTHNSLQKFEGAPKVEVITVVDLAELNRHQSENVDGADLHEREAALIKMFENTANVSVPKVWDLQLQIGNFESVAYGNLTPLIRSIVRSPIGRNLSLPTLTLDHVTTQYIMTTLKEEFLAPESKVKVLDFEGSQLPPLGWEQLAQLAESKKPLERVRFTGMQIPSHIAGRLGMLRSVGINMAGCNVKVVDLINMVAGWLGKESILRGVDLRGNEVNNLVAYMFVDKGFDVYLEEHTLPKGLKFAKR